MDPANVINGLLLCSIYKKDFSKVDQLLKNIWYITNDYGVVPYDTTLANIHPGFWQEEPYNTIRALVFPATSIERYVLSAMALDNSLTLIPITKLQSTTPVSTPTRTSTPGVIPTIVVTPTPLPGDLNSDGHVNLFDYNLLVAGFGSKYTIFDYNNLVANFGK